MHLPCVPTQNKRKTWKCVLVDQTTFDQFINYNYVDTDFTLNSHFDWSFSFFLISLLSLCLPSLSIRLLLGSQLWSGFRLLWWPNSFVISASWLQPTVVCLSGALQGRNVLFSIFCPSLLQLFYFFSTTTLWPFFLSRSLTPNVPLLLQERPLEISCCSTLKLEDFGEVYILS